MLQKSQELAALVRLFMLKTEFEMHSSQTRKIIWEVLAKRFENCEVFLTPRSDLFQSHAQSYANSIVTLNSLLDL